MNSSVLQFGEFELDARNHRLLRSGLELKLERIPMELLILLASRPGELVRREEILQELWGDEINVDSENAINTAIRKIRQVLGDDSSSPRFVQTISKRGYRFVADSKRQAAPPKASASNLQAVHTENFRSKMIRWTLLAGLAALLGIGLIVWSIRTFPKILRVSNYVAITHDGLPKQGPLLSDGVRIYFVSGNMNHRSISQISVNGGEASTLVSDLQSPQLMDISPNGSELLVASFGPDAGASMGKQSRRNESALWGISLPSGNVRRIGDLFADAGAFAPDGQEIVFGWNHGLYVVNIDGADPRQIAPLPGTASSIRWSPDGKRLRLTIMDPRTLRSSLWELLRDGTSLHELLGGWNPAPAECCGRWSSDGRWYVFQSTRNGRTDLWAVPEPSGLFDRKQSKPIQLTAGPIHSLAPEMSPNGQKLYMIGQQLRGELNRFDTRLKQFVPYLHGVSAEFVDFSRDGKWIAYVSFPDHLLWRCNVQGDHCFQLTGPAIQPTAPRWSPDGTRIAFFDASSGKPFKLFIVPANGGSPEVVVDEPWNEIDPNWSPDGQALVFSHFPVFDRQADLGVYSFDLLTHRLAKLPGSDGLWMPRLSPDGSLILARSADSLSLLLFDVSRQSWHELVSGESFGYANWSLDSRFVYFLKRGNEPAIERIRVSDGRTELVASLTGVRQTGFRNAVWMGLTPDKDPLILRDVGTEELYSLDAKAP